MINSEVFIIKRDGKKETFSLDKIKNAIAKAFLSVGSFATQDVITTVSVSYTHLTLPTIA